MDCHKANEMIPDYALDLLSPEERSALQAHLDGGCQQCQQEVDEMTEAATLLGESLNPVLPKPSLKKELLERIAREPQISSEPTKVPASSLSDSEKKPTRLLDYLPYAAATLLAVAAGSLLANALNRSNAEPSLAQNDPQLLEQWQRNIDAAQAAFGPPQAQLIGFNADLQQDQLQVAVFFDGIASQLHVIASKVPPSPAERSLYIWLLDNEGKVLLGSPLKPLQNQRAAALLDLPNLPKNIARALITSELEGNPTEPSGPVIQRATLKQTT